MVTIARFGNLTLDPRLGWFECDAIWNGEIVRVSFNPFEADGLAEVLQTAEAVFENQVAWKQKVDDYAVQELLDVKNEGWLAEGEKELSRTEFKKRMTLFSITFEPDGHFEFWHDDGDLFWDHSILVRGNLKEGLTEADIAG